MPAGLARWKKKLKRMPAGCARWKVPANKEMIDRLKTILDALSSGVPVLTVNSRLSRYLLTRFEGAEVTAGRTLWKTPMVMPLSSWITSLWQETHPAKALLSEARSFALWKKIIRLDAALQTKMIFPEGAARLAFKAYDLIKKYNVSLPKSDLYLTEEARAFKRWLGEYSAEIKRLGFTDEVSLLEEVSELVRNGGGVLPDKIFLAGFDEVTPAMEGLIAALGGRGCGVEFWPQRPGSALPARDRRIRADEIREYPDMRAEVRASARWARKEAKAKKKVGVIVPQLNRYRVLVTNEFSAELDPLSTIPWETEKEVFNISLGTPLAHEPIVRSALALISIGLEKEDARALIKSLSSPYFITCEAEGLGVSRLGAGVTEKKILSIGLTGLMKEAIDASHPMPETFTGRLASWTRFLGERGKKTRVPSEWAGFFDNLLKGLSWPSPNITLTSREYQALEAWQGLLSSFSSLDDVTGRLTRKEAVRELRAMAGETIHQPESEGERPVEVLGLLEAAGMDFDALWILGAHEDALPGEAAPNPFIPLEIQKSAGLPRSTPEKTLEFARTALSRLIESAPSVVASFPRVMDGKELRSSPLLGAPGGLAKDPACLPSHRLKDSVHAAHAVEAATDSMKVPLREEELKTIRGGTGIIKEQSACPFRAFAIYRLGARSAAPAGPGIDAMERGSLVHEALQNFWSDVRDSRGLHKADEDGSLPSLIKKAVAKAMERFGRDARTRIPAKMLELESERLEGLLKEWMGVELLRGEFTVVEMEKKQDINVGGLTIGARLDRVDEVEGGAKIIIDYKTGVCKKDDWLPGRPREPQLLLYAMDGGFNALAFASLRVKGTRFVGIGEADEVLPGVKGIGSDKKWRLKIEGVENWADLNERWRASLIAIAEEFVGGEARVDPNPLLKDNDFPCKYCELAILCRRTELGLFDDNGNNNEG